MNRNEGKYISPKYMCRSNKNESGIYDIIIGSGNPTEAVPFTRDEINKMLTGMQSGFKYNTKGLEAQPGEQTLTTDILNNYLASLRTPGRSYAHCYYETN